MSRPRFRNCVAYPSHCYGLDELLSDLRKEYFPEWKINELLMKPSFRIYLSFMNDLELFINHMEQHSQNTKQFNFQLRCATVQPSGGGGYTIELIADEGLQHFLRLFASIDNGNIRQF
ncbi:MAG: hypothetical protein AAFV93_16065, partial [Chloroflexota bacterium]